MEFKFLIPTEDLDIVIDNIDYFKKLFPRFEILSDNFIVEDETFVEYSEGVDMFSFKEVVFQLDHLNNFWAMAKFVHEFKSRLL